MNEQRLDDEKAVDLVDPVFVCDQPVESARAVRRSCAGSSGLRRIERVRRAASRATATRTEKPVSMRSICGSSGRGGARWLDRRAGAHGDRDLLEDAGAPTPRVPDRGSAPNRSPPPRDCGHADPAADDGEDGEEHERDQHRPRGSRGCRGMRREHGRDGRWSSDRLASIGSCSATGQSFVLSGIRSRLSPKKVMYQSRNI